MRCHNYCAPRATPILLNKLQSHTLMYQQTYILQIPSHWLMHQSQHELRSARNGVQMALLGIGKKRAVACQQRVAILARCCRKDSIGGI